MCLERARKQEVWAMRQHTHFIPAKISELLVMQEQLQQMMQHWQMLYVHWQTMAVRKICV